MRCLLKPAADEKHFLTLFRNPETECPPPHWLKLSFPPTSLQDLSLPHRLAGFELFLSL
jgi:hypothetical protein